MRLVNSHSLQHNNIQSQVCLPLDRLIIRSQNLMVKSWWNLLQTQCAWQSDERWGIKKKFFLVISFGFFFFGFSKIGIIATLAIICHYRSFLSEHMQLLQPIFYSAHKKKIILVVTGALKTYAFTYDLLNVMQHAMYYYYQLLLLLL